MMMREEDKPFICYKSKWSVKIMPRNAAGWRYTLYWMLPFFAMVAGTIWISTILESNGTDEQKIVAVVVTSFVVLSTAWAVALIRWTRNRSEIIDMDELVALKRELDRSNKLKRR
jgi:hypothetical protein